MLAYTRLKLLVVVTDTDLVTGSVLAVVEVAGADFARINAVVGLPTLLVVVNCVVVVWAFLAVAVTFCVKFGGVRSFGDSDLVEAAVLAIVEVEDADMARTVVVDGAGSLGGLSALQPSPVQTQVSVEKPGVSTEWHPLVGRGPS